MNEPETPTPSSPLARSAPESRWLFLLMLMSPLGFGATCDDDAVVGDECAVGSTSDRCGPDGAAGDAGVTGGSAGVDPTGGKANAPTTGGKASEPAGGKPPSANGGSGGANGAAICGGLLGAGCAKDEFCYYSPEARCGAADQTGVCRPRPDACDAVHQPVCGCDDTTYGNACEAASNGVSVAAQGECKSPPGRACGSRGLAECPDGEFCSFAPEANCGRADAPGVCKVKPEGCIEIHQPVCGCDGKTYGNSCEAESKGVSPETQGECGAEPDPSPGKACGLIGGCEAGEFCFYDVGDACGVFDAPGECLVPPKGCTKEYQPVCGCDNVVYGNRCMAQAAGVGIQSEGECDGQPDPDKPVCGGIAGIACEDEGEFCNYPPEAMCGAADRTGFCQTIPDGCIAIVDPVCGCDGKTYSNSCMAAANGVSVQSVGACE